mmetsp:Transcript_61716/g.75673  ORF Transcript_61716/g.75673 Transcript_61716/m.75673 type:complete len:109 (+) Transcript_61716:38-364(+)
MSEQVMAIGNTTENGTENTTEMENENNIINNNDKLPLIKKCSKDKIPENEEKKFLRYKQQESIDIGCCPEYGFYYNVFRKLLSQSCHAGCYNPNNDEQVLERINDNQY